MRKWPRLAAWIKEEARSAEWYSAWPGTSPGTGREMRAVAGPGVVGSAPTAGPGKLERSLALPVLAARRSAVRRGPDLSGRERRVTGGRSPAASRGSGVAPRSRCCFLLVTIRRGRRDDLVHQPAEKRAIEEFVTLQKRQGEAQSAAEQAQAEDQKARNGTIEQSSKLELLSQNAKILRRNRRPRIPARRAPQKRGSCLLGSQLSATRIQELQGQLNAATTQRDSTAPRNRDLENLIPLLPKTYRGPAGPAQHGHD